jgi:hypothetical protein
MYANINELYKNITDLDKSNGLLKNYYMLPGFNIIESNNISSSCHTLNNTSILTKDNSVINDKLFMKFLGFFDNTNNQTQRAKNKLSKKQVKPFTRKHKQKQKQKQKPKIET